MADKLPLKAGESVFQSVNQSPRHRPEVKKSSFFTTVEGGGNSLQFSEDRTDGPGNGRRGSGADEGRSRGSSSGTSTPDSSASPRRPRKPMGSFFNTVDATGHDTFQFPSERGEGRPKKRNGNGNGDDVYQSPKHTPRVKSSMFATVDGGGNSLQFDSEKPKQQPAKPAIDTDVTDSPKKLTPEASADPLFDKVEGGINTLGVTESQTKTSRNPSPVFDTIDHSSGPRHSGNPLTHSDDESPSKDKSPENGVNGPVVETKPKKEPVDWVMYYTRLLCKICVRHLWWLCGFAIWWIWVHVAIQKTHYSLLRRPAIQKACSQKVLATQKLSGFLSSGSSE